LLNCASPSAYGYDQRLEAFGDKAMFHAHNVSPTTVQKYDATGTGQAEPFIDAFLVRYAGVVPGANSRCSLTEFATERTTTPRSTMAVPR